MTHKKKGKLGNLKGFSLQFMPYSEIRHLDSTERIKKILEIILGSNILILQGRLRPEEETRLIEDTMAMISHIKDFKGIELAVIGNVAEETGLFNKLRNGVVNVLSGGDLGSMTVIGPATIVKEIKRNPKKLELFLNK
jgi:hypothetical protein